MTANAQGGDGAATEPEARRFRVTLPHFLWVALVVSMGFVFLSVVSVPLTLSALWGLTGGYSLPIWSVICAIFGLSLATEYGSRAAQREEDSWPARGDVGSLYVLFIVFLGYLNLFVSDAYVASGRGLIPAHDSIQYYMQLHSFAIDRDVDFSNEYEMMPRVVEDMGRWRPLDIGKDYNVAPVGSALTWLPFYAAAFPCLYLLQAAGVEVSIDGISSPFVMAAGFASGFLVFVGMALLYATLRKWFSWRSALCSALLLYGATNLPWYITGNPWMSHAPSFFTASVVIFVWSMTRVERTPAGWFLLGATIGLALLVRPSHVALLAFPLVDAATMLARRDERARGLIGLALSVTAMLVVFSAQLATWYVRSGAEAPPGNPMTWTEPALLLVLFSSHNGLAAWHPVTLLGFVAVPFLWRRSRELCVCLALVLAVQWYLNAAIFDWSGGGSFGMRRFVGTLPFLAPGIAITGSWAVGLLRRRPLVLAGVGVAALVVYNFTLMIGHRDRMIGAAIPMPFGHVWTVSGLVIQDAIGHPFSFPANHLFASQRGLTATQYDMLSSDRNYGKQIEASGVMLRMYLGQGWKYDLREQLNATGYATAAEQECQILLPLLKRQRYEVAIEIAPPPDMQELQSVDFRLNGVDVGSAQLQPEIWSRISFVLSRDVTRTGLNDLTLTFQQSKEEPYSVYPLPPGSVLGFNEEVEARYHPPQVYWGGLRSLALKPLPREPRPKKRPEQETPETEGPQ